MAALTLVPATNLTPLLPELRTPAVTSVYVATIPAWAKSVYVDLRQIDDAFQFERDASDANNAWEGWTFAHSYGTIRRLNIPKGVHRIMHTRDNAVQFSQEVMPPDDLVPMSFEPQVPPELTLNGFTNDGTFHGLTPDNAIAAGAGPWWAFNDWTRVLCVMKLNGATEVAMGFNYRPSTSLISGGFWTADPRSPVLFSVPTGNANTPAIDYVSRVLTFERGGGDPTLQRIEPWVTITAGALTGGATTVDCRFFGVGR